MPAVNTRCPVCGAESWQWGGVVRLARRLVDRPVADHCLGRRLVSGHLTSPKLCQGPVIAKYANRFDLNAATAYRHHGVAV